ncbi:MAG: Gfo/Idh/MocA family oxidoreductase [Candidatus Goldbacteria bacterium]|nr:Gfo/Idh/MocA family oxidoreductase [Candidatus Goldiibacteriota bacterium]
MKTIKIAYLGAGEISDRFILMAQKLKDVQNVAIYSRHIENAKKKAEKYNIPFHYDDYKEMLEEIKPDAVVITTPHSLHAKHAIDCMKAGCHVLVEKPVATNFKDAKKMYETSIKYKKILNGLPFDLYPQFTAALKYIKEKYIGKITSAHSELSFPGPPRLNWYYDKKIAHGGAMLDVGCYALSRLISIMGPVKKVSAFSNMLIPKRLLPGGKKVKPSVDDNNVLILEFAGGVFATVKASWQHPFLENRTIIYGRHGAIYINFDNLDEYPLIVHTKKKIPGKKIKWRNLPNCYLPKLPSFNPEDDIMGKFISAIRNGKQPVYDAGQSLHIVEVMHKAYISAKTGKIQKITTPFRIWWNKEKEIQNFKEKYL